MNAKLAKMVEDMKKQTIGVEIEMAGITRQEAAKVIAKYFGTERTVKYEAGSYDSWSCQDRQGRTWKITRDVSIHASSDIKKPWPQYPQLPSSLVMVSTVPSG